MEVDLHNTYNMMIMTMMTMIMMMKTMKMIIALTIMVLTMMIKMSIAVSQSIFKLRPPDFAWK